MNLSLKSITKLLIIVGAIICVMLLIMQVNLPHQERHTFQSTAVYTAPKSQLELRIASSGFVLKGDDLGEGTAFVKVYGTTKIADTLYLRTSPETIDSLRYKEASSSFTWSREDTSQFYSFLIALGYQGIDKNEVYELLEAMTVINYGPKAQFMEGQTEYIVVSESSFSYGN